MPRLTEEQLQELERRYAPADQQKCVVCGAPLTFGSSGPHGSEYVCSSDDASALKSSLRVGKQVEHYMASRWVDRRATDLGVLALIQEVRESRLPGHEQLDLVQVDTAREVLQAAYSAVTAVMSPPIDEPGFHARYLELVQDAIRELLRQWDAAPREDARS